MVAPFSDQNIRTERCFFRRRWCFSGIADWSEPTDPWINWERIENRPEYIRNYLLIQKLKRITVHNLLDAWTYEVTSPARGFEEQGLFKAAGFHPQQFWSVGSSLNHSLIYFITTTDSMKTHLMEIYSEWVHKESA